jgi:hypothetical protein
MNLIMMVTYRESISVHFRDVDTYNHHTTITKSKKELTLFSHSDINRLTTICRTIVLSETSINHVVKIWNVLEKI